MSKLLFPHDELRPIQEEVVSTILKSLDGKQSVVIHAPTGLGKTAASLAPSLSFAFFYKFMLETICPNKLI